jgi:hypothetical protein
MTHITLHTTNSDEVLEIRKDGVRTGHRLELLANERWALRDDANSVPKAFSPQFDAPEDIQKSPELIEGSLADWRKVAA